MESEKRRFFEYVDASVYHVISKEVENRISRKNCIARHKFMFKQLILVK